MLRQCNLVVTLLVIAGVCGMRAHASTWYVATNGNDAATDGGTNWATAFATISNAMAKVSPDHTVLISNGTYKITAPIAIPNFAPDITIRGLYGATNTIIDGQGNVRCAEMYRGLVDGITFSNGYSAAQGGGIYWRAYSGVIRNCVFTDCGAETDGGAICMLYWGGGEPAPVISNVTFRNNNAGVSAGGMYSRFEGARISNCRFAGNQAAGIGGLDGGGGIFLSSWTNIIEGCTFISNRSTGARGGAIRLHNGASETMVVSNCTMIANAAFLGGGIYVNTAADIIDCTLVSNQTLLNGHGGGIYTMGTGTRILNCRILYNNAMRDGGGVYNKGLLRGSLLQGNIATNLGGGVYDAGGTVVNCTITDNESVTNTGGGLYLESGGVENSIVYFNTAAVADGSNWTYAAGYFTNTCAAPSVAAYGAGNITDDPLFADFNAGDYRLQSRSPCVNAGLNQDWMFMAVDLDGFPRVRQRIVDMGAFEGLRGGAFITVR